MMMMMMMMMMMIIIIIIIIIIMHIKSIYMIRSWTSLATYLAHTVHIINSHNFFS